MAMRRTCTLAVIRTSRAAWLAPIRAVEANIVAAVAAPNARQPAQHRNGRHPLVAKQRKHHRMRRTGRAPRRTATQRQRNGLAPAPVPDLLPAFPLHLREKRQRHGPHRLAHEAREHIDQTAGAAEERDGGRTIALPKMASGAARDASRKDSTSGFARKRSGSFAPPGMTATREASAGLKEAGAETVTAVLMVLPIARLIGPKPNAARTTDVTALANALLTRIVKICPSAIRGGGPPSTPRRRESSRNWSPAPR